MRFRLAVVTLLFAHAAWSGPITTPGLTQQIDACVDGSSHCSQAASGTVTNGGDTLSFTGNLAAAGFGIMHVSTDITSYSVTNGTALSYGYVGFVDFLTISDPAKTGQTGTLNMSYFFDGVVGKTGQSSAFLQVVGRICTPDCTTVLPANNYVGDFNPSPLVPFQVYNQTVLIPNNFSFIYGSQFELYFSMQATAGTVVDTNGLGYTNPVVTSAGSGYANFANTFVLNGLGTGDPNATYSALSTTTYSSEGVVPEPATILLCGLPLALIAFVTAKKKSLSAALSSSCMSHSHSVSETPR
jgi:hypothetical protein